MRRRLAIALGALLAAAVPGPAAATAADYFPFPAGYSISGTGVAADGAGNVWFGVGAPTPPGGMQNVSSLGRVVPGQTSPGTTNGITFYPTPDPPSPACCATRVTAVDYGAAQDRMFFVRNDGVVGYVTPGLASPGTTAGMTTAHLAGNQGLLDVAAAPGGGAWFTEYTDENSSGNHYGNRIAFFDVGAPSEGPNLAFQDGNTTINQSRYDAKPAGIAVTPAGTPWFVEEDAGNPGYRVATYGGSGSHYDEYAVSPCDGQTTCSGANSGQGLHDLAIAPDGGIWITNMYTRRLIRFDPVTHVMSQYTMASIDPSVAAYTPRQITAAPDGTLWMTAWGSGSYALVRIVPAATPTASAYPVQQPLGVAADNAGNIWFGVSGNGAGVGRLSGVVGATLPPSGGTPTATPAPTPDPATPAPGATKPPTVLKPVTVGTATLTPPQTGNGAVNTDQVCAGPPAARCSIIYLIKEHEYVTGFPSSLHAKKKPKHAPRVLGTKTVTLQGGQKAKVTVKLNKLGQRILKGKHKLKIVFTATQKLANGKTKTITKKTLTLRSH